MSETPERLVLSTAAAGALSALARALLSAARARALYPAEHPAARSALARFRIAIEDASEAGVASAISVTPAALFVGGAAVPGDATLAETAALLHTHGILEIGFDPVVPDEAAARLLELLACPPDAIESQGNVATAWSEQGHPAIRIEAVDYRKVLEDRDTTTPQRDDLWRAIVSALASGRRTLDEREQKRLLELAGDPAELAAFAETLSADKCAPDGSPMVTTQAATVLAGFHHLMSIASVLAPDRLRAIRENLATAVLQMNPHVAMQLLSLESQTSEAGQIAGAMSDEGVAQLLATVLALEGQASPRVAQVFDLLVPDQTRRRGVLERARTLARARHTGDRPFDACWQSFEELLLSYNDQAYVTSQYRAMLDGTGAGSGSAVAARPVAELPDWIDTVGEDHLRHLSIVLLGDLLQLEPRTDRAIVVLNHLAMLADDLLLSGTYDGAVQVLEAVRDAVARTDLQAAATQTLQQVGTAAGVREATAIMADLGQAEWALLAQCFGTIGASCLEVLGELLLTDTDHPAAERAGDVFVGIGADAVPALLKLLDQGASTVRLRVAPLLGRIASPLAVPALQALLRAHDSRVLQAAVRALAAIDDPAAARAIQIALRTPDAKAREMVVDALVAAADRRVVPMLVRVLESSRPLRGDKQVTLHALDALARLRDARAVPPVTAVMGLRRSWLGRAFSRRRLRTVKRSAVQTLVAIGDEAALLALDHANRNGDRLLRSLVRELHVRAVAGAA
jgi:hypothetical protein